MILPLIALMAGTQVEANWTPLFSTANYMMYVDQSTIRLLGNNIRSAWLRREYQTKQVGGEVYDVIKVRFDCANEESGLLSIITYDANNKPIRNFNYKPHEVNMAPQAPGTSGMGALEAVCGATAEQ